MRAYKNEAKVTAALDNVDTAPLEEPLRATLKLLGKLTKEHAVSADDMRAVLATGATKQHIEDALAVCFCFNIIDRCADTFAFYVPGPASFAFSAKFLLKRGYKL